MQWEFAGRLGPPPGRYVVRRFAGDDARAVVVVAEFAGPPPRRRRWSRSPRRVPAGAPLPASVPVTRVTVIDALPLADGDAARDWFAGDVQPAAIEAASVLVRLVAAQRVAAADASLADPDLARALAARVGFGSGEQVADGLWESARELAPADRTRRGRRTPGRPAERLAALMAGRDAALACEELALRARADLDAGRDREAAIQLEAALTAALAELEGWRAFGDLPDRLAELAGWSPAVAAAAAAARAGTLDPAGMESASAALARLEAALRARAAFAA